jgi:hypothetical protein
MAKKIKNLVSFFYEIGSFRRVLRVPQQSLFLEMNLTIFLLILSGLLLSAIF